MSSQPHQPAVPFLVVSDGLVATCSDFDTFAVASKRAIERGFFRDCWIADVVGHAYAVESFEIVREPFWKRPKLAGLGRGLRLRHFVFRDLGVVALTDVVARVRDSMAAHAWHWEARGDWASLPQSLANATMIGDVIDALRAP